MLGEEASELCGVLLGLNSIDFGYVVCFLQPLIVSVRSHTC